jgi:hypothetical protein
MAGCLGIGGVSFSRCQSLSDHAKSGRFFRRSLIKKARPEIGGPFPVIAYTFRQVALLFIELNLVIS